MSAYEPSSQLTALVWLLMGSTGSTPGVLRMARGRLVFEAHGRGALTGGQLREIEQRAGAPGLAQRLEQGYPTPIFDAPLGAVGKVTFPWYYFGGGMKLTVAGSPYRFSFLRPQNTRPPSDVSGLADIPAGRAAGRAWKAALRNAVIG